MPVRSFPCSLLIALTLLLAALPGAARAQNGPCCAIDGTCFITDLTNCNAAFGTWLQPFTSTCGPDTCTTRACCTGSSCTLRVSFICVSQLGGAWLPFVTSCTPAPCPVGTVGACCFTSGACAVADQPTCLQLSGNWQSSSVPTCAPGACTNLRACCLQGGPCVLLTQAACNANFGTFNAAVTACTPTLCLPSGACCVGTSCSFVPQGQCTSGVFEPSVVCSAGNTCPIGACCDSGGNCITASQQNCAAAGNRFLGLGIACSPTPCPVVTCCFGNSCVRTAEPFCTPSGGQVVTVSNTCSPNPCGPGICCGLYSGGCTIMTAADCQNFDAYFLTGSSCSPNPCTPATGACCTGLSSCAVATRSLCQTAGGNWVGPATLCSPAAICCRADFNRSGLVSVQDVFDFLTAFFAPCP